MNEMFEDYVKYTSLSGRSSTEALINNSIRKYELKFNTSPSFYQVDIDGEIVDTIINKTRNFNVKLVHFRYDYEPKVGSVITYQNKKHLLLRTDRDEVYPIGEMEECNNWFKVQTGEKEEILIGYDHLEKPQYKVELIEKEVPCIVRDRYYSTNENAQLPLPDGKLDIYLTYQESPSFDINKKFLMYGKTYKITDISYTDVVDNAGVMRIHAERIDNRNE